MHHCPTTSHSTTYIKKFFNQIPLFPLFEVRSGFYLLFVTRRDAAFKVQSLIPKLEIRSGRQGWSHWLVCQRWQQRLPLFLHFHWCRCGSLRGVICGVPACARALQRNVPNGSRSYRWGFCSASLEANSRFLGRSKS